MGVIVKKQGWQGEYVAHLQERMHVPFDPGSLDCAIAAADAVYIITGEDHAAIYRGNYKTLAEGYRAIRKAGFVDHIEYAASLFEELPSALFAQAGDLAVIPDGEGHDTLGIVQGENIYVMRPTGYGIVKLTMATRAFRT